MGLEDGEQDGRLVGTAVGDPDGELLGHCDEGIMLGPLVGAALGLQNYRGAAWKRRGAATLQPTTRALTRPPPLEECVGRGPNRF